MLPVLILLTFAWASHKQDGFAQSTLRSGVSKVGATTDPCTDSSIHPAVKDAFQLVCSKERIEGAEASPHAAIVIGFLGGFVSRDDLKHPEVSFANYVRNRYGPAVDAEVFGNHQGQEALNLVLERVYGNNPDSARKPGNQTTQVILYGHSWGASQVLEFARELERRGVPVALTIQVDSVRKMGQNDRTVPANVAKAVNFYQRKGFTPGRPLIVPADKERTTILGNFHMTYKDAKIRCDNYRWLSRKLNKPHHLIENDPHVWDRIVSLIDSELIPTSNTQAAQSRQ